MNARRARGVTISTTGLDHVALALLVTCALGGSGCGSSEPPSQGTARAGAGGTNSAGNGASPGAAGASGEAAPHRSIRPTRYRIPDPMVAVPPCAQAGSGTISNSKVLFGQTHLTPAGWPFQTVSADRPLTVAIAATGTGTAPNFMATAVLDGRELDLCLTGPAQLPASSDDLSASIYRGAVPADWVKPGLQLRVTVGASSETFQVAVKAASWLMLYLVDAQLFGRGMNDETSDAQLLELLARLPMSYLDVSKSPFGAWRPGHLLIESRDDGRAPDGSSASHPRIVVGENPHCSEADMAASTCSPHSGFGTMSGVLQALDTFRDANGVQSSSTWYADLAVELGGGLAGGQRGTGDDTALTMNHELGHAWGFPHWDREHTAYPYEGVQRNRGGFGDRWAIDQMTGMLIPMLCENLERQSPMQRASSCVPEGSWFDPYSDYEAARLLRMTLGASEVSGMVDYSGGVAGAATRPFELPEESGLPLMAWNEAAPGFRLERYDQASNAFIEHVPREWHRVIEAEVPVIMFSGGLIVGGEAFFETPLSYVGNVLGKLDPSDPADYATLYAIRDSELYWAHDLCLRFTLANGSVFYRLHVSEAELRTEGDAARFAFNLPRELGDAVVKLELIQRPLGHFDAASRLDASDSAANYFEVAQVLGTWQK